MKSALRGLHVLELLVIGVVALPGDAQVRTGGLWARVEVPTFRSAEEALEWSKVQVSGSGHAASKQAAQSGLMRAASAAAIAQEWGGVADVVQLEAALTGGEAFLGLDAPANAQATMARVRRETVDGSPLGAAIYERSAEAAELLGHRRAALLGFQRGLLAAPAPGWKALLLYRAGMNALFLGDSATAAASLERAFAEVSVESRRDAAISIALGWAYLNLKDKGRAEAWVQKATLSLNRRAGGATTPSTDVPTFVAEPSDGDLRAEIQGVEEGLRNIH